ncbi:bifunctional glycoside hydrolase 114/ polysaccharide deacetylase family protein [Sphaerotilus sp.]|uniref:bifunctional glycoside hydrolase 114/ polysaccharide deacetylase family protein n=1 Tax=Sphaerotilus sp. TaxID=2093942 RepID=UPI0025D4A57C|nr:bifunctional glycoside hydrolase 114/ polysaccharide deacetylase family protein [Sphaerotilus sp.]
MNLSVWHGWARNWLCAGLRGPGGPWLTGLLAACGLWLTGAAQALAPVLPGPSVALHYGATPPWSALSAFDWVVLEPGHHGDMAARAKAAPHTRFMAYLSVGEVSRTHPQHASLPAAWLVGRNPAWDSAVIDQRAPEWPAWFVQNVARPQWERGYRGFFLDTLDSYQLVAKTPEERAAHEAGLVRVVKALKVAFPDAKLIFNRGFEILPQVAQDADMVAAESLYRGWDNGNARYKAVSDADRAWLIGQLDRVRAEHRLPVLAIDYVAPNERALARETAQRIQSHGFIPWVSTPSLDAMGIGAVEVLPRRLILLHDSPIGTASAQLTYADALRFTAMPAYYLGLVPEFVNVDEQPLPGGVQAGEVAGVVTQFSNDRPRPALAAWLQKAMAAGVKVVSLEQLGVGDATVQRDTYGLQRRGTTAPVQAPVTFSKRDASIGFEITPVPGKLDFNPLGAPAGSDVLLQSRDARGATMDAVAITPWGGYALAGYSLVRLAAGEDEYRWAFDPIAFLRRALALPAMPVPDTTTESGRRLLMVHIDGDGFANRSDLRGSPLASEVLLTDVLERYRVPTAMSIIEGETAPHGLYPKLSAQMEGIARRMFALPHVEVATHTFSHPFTWSKVEAGAFGKGYALDLPGYRFDAEREIQGSIAYIQSRLAPPNKPVVLVQWSGDTNPNEATLATLEKSGVLAINGGETVVTKAQPSLTHVGPLGIRKGRFFQVYAPNQNENVYTNHFTGPLYGFERVIETFELTERPYRLKPVNIYFHTYAASRRASLEALHRAYRWAMAQPLHPVYPSDYVRKAMNYEDIVIARGDGGFLVRGAGALRELRAPRSLGVPQIQGSRGFVGHSEAEQGQEQYLHLGGGGDAWVPFAPARDNAAYLVEANARVLSVERTDSATRLQLQAHVPLRMAIRHPGGCAVSLGGRRLTAVRTTDGIHHYASDQHGTETLTIGCL